MGRDPLASASVARLVFLGTPEAAVAPLRTLVDAGHDVALVVSRPDRRRGRGGGVAASPVKMAANDLGLPVTDDMAAATGVGAELGVVVAFGRIIPTALLARLPMVNLHFSLLPRWRGAAPVERAILEGDAETGVCLMEVAAGLDTGALYAVEATDVGEEETAEELRARLVVLGCRLLDTHLRHGRRSLPVPHDQAGEPSYAEKILPAELELRWEQGAEHLRRTIRLGRAWTTFRGRRLTVLRATAPDASAEGPPPPAPGGGAEIPGTLDGVDVVTGDGTRCRLVTVQPEGRRPMAADDWLRGARPAPGERLGG